MSIENERRRSGLESGLEARREVIMQDLRGHIRNLRTRADELERDFDTIVEARLRGDYDKRYDLNPVREERDGRQ